MIDFSVPVNNIHLKKIKNHQFVYKNMINMENRALQQLKLIIHQLQTGQEMII